jgi:hypothetical protein
MRRLVGFIGNINSSDVDIYYSDGTVNAIITNEDKIINGKKKAGLIEYTTKSENNRLVVYVDWVGVEPEYQNTRVAMILLKAFDKDVLTPFINEYDKDKVTIQANFQNRDLADLTRNMAEKRGINFNDSNKSENVQDTNKDYVEKLKNNGINAEWKRGTIYINNDPIIEVARKLEDDNAAIEIFNGEVTNGGSNIEYTIFSEVGFNTNLFFYWKVGESVVTFNCETDDLLKNITDVDNFCRVFDGLALKPYDDWIEYDEVRNTITNYQNGQENVAKQKIKRLIQR